jgi:hypothetical protein
MVRVVRIELTTPSASGWWICLLSYTRMVSAAGVEPALFSV